MKADRDVPLTAFKPHVQTYAIKYQQTGQYQLLGHGFLSILSDEVDEIEVHYLEVESVQDAEVLLRSRMRLQNSYEQQRGSVIAWTDQEQRYHDLAISFESDKECDIIWRLICEKVGKNYLQLSGRESLKMPDEHNLPYILEQTKSSKDMVEYNLLNNPLFGQALSSLFKGFQDKNDKMGMGMLARILKSILSNIDYRMVQALFKDPVFQLILDVQKFARNVDFPRLWAEALRIRHIIPLSQELTTKVHLMHRLSFYRENILDLKVDGYLENILIMTHQEFGKDIIQCLTKEDILDQLIRVTYEEAQEKQLLSGNDMEEETGPSEIGKAKFVQFGQKKIEFVLEAIIIAKQMENQNVKLRFFDKIIKSGFMELATDYFDKGLLKALDFFNCFAKLAPKKVVQYLKTKYRENPSDNLHTKLSKKYCTGDETVQNLILEMLVSLSEGLRLKENLDFFIGTFFASVFVNCKDSRPILNLVCQMQSVLQNVEAFFTQAIKNKVFQKLVVFLRNQRQDKRSELRTIKILKRVLLENADSSWSYRKAFLNLLNKQIINSGYFDYCMTVLEKHIRFNNIISSSMLENVKIVRGIDRFTPFHQQIQNNFRGSQSLAKYIAKILEVKDQKNDESDPFGKQRARIEEEKEQAYLMSQVQNEPTAEKKNSAESRDQLQNLTKLRQQIEQDRMQIQEVQKMANPGKKLKPNEEINTPVVIQFDLPFDDNLEEKQ